MNFVALLQAFALFISLFALALMIGVRVLRRQDLDTFIKQQEREAFQRRMAKKAEELETSGETPRSLGWESPSGNR